jgi:hypothetical protein
MTDPAAGAGGVIIMSCLIVVTPASILLHSCSRRYFSISFGIALSSFLFWFVLWVWLDVLDPKAGSRMWYSLPMVLAGFWLPFVFSAIIGALFYLIRCSREVTHKDP